MTKPITSALLLGLTITTLSAFSLFGTAACGDDASKLTKGKSSSSSGSSGDDTAEGGLTASAAQAAAEAQFRALQSDLDRTCGNVCHNKAATAPQPPNFLSDQPDPYISIKAYKGIVVKDPTQSIIWSKPAHSGPAIGDTPDLQKKVQAWLTAESVAIVVEKKPTTAPVAVANGPNDIDLTSACSGGMTGVHLKFTASLVGGLLSFNDMKVAVPAGSDAHLLHIQFFKKLQTPKADGTDEISDAQDSFSNLDVQLPNGAETSISSGILFTSDGWTPYDFAADKIRIQVEKLEPGKVKDAAQSFDCKDPAGFVTKVLPSMQAGSTFGQNCTQCHSQANATAGLNLTQQTNGALDQKFVCSSVLQKITDRANIANSKIVKEPSTAGNGHPVQVNNAANWAKLFTDNQAVFY